MASITIRDVPDETRNELAARAARSGRSLQEFLRLELIALGARPDVRELTARVRSRKASTDADLDVEAIVAHLHADRR
jgi:antitoxin FitA